MKQQNTLCVPRWLALIINNVLLGRTAFMRVSNRILLAIAVLASAALPPVSAIAANGPTVVRGRVLNTLTGKYILNAQVSIAGTGLTANTDDYGEYIITNVPVGEMIIRAVYGDLTPKEHTISVIVGRTVEQDFDLTRANDDIVMLEQYKVQSRREIDGKLIALNEQRYSVNIKNVVSSEEFGDVTEGNIGEFMKYLPGLVVDYNAADARTVSVRGLPPSATNITMDGLQVASAASGDSTRTFEFEQVTINNASRIEVTKSPTPDMPANALGGAVNLISKSAFERSKPSTTVRAFINMNSTQRDSGAQPIGLDGNYKRLIRPGFDFTHINPLTKNFGIVVTGLNSNQYNPQILSQTNWVPGGGNANASTPAIVAGANPYMNSYRLQTSPKLSSRSSVGLTLDWRATRQDVLTLRYQYSKYDTKYYILNYTFDTGGLAAAATQEDFGPDHTNGGTAGSANSSTNFRSKYGTTWLANIGYRHNGPIWKIDAGLSASQATNHYRDMDEGYFNTVNAGIRNVTVKFSDITRERPGQITLTKGGVTIDPYDLIKQYLLQTTDSSTNANGYTGSVATNQRDALDKVEQAFANARRSFGGRIPFTLQAGGDIRRQTRDITTDNRVFKFTGPAPSTTETQPAGSYVNNSYSTVAAPFGWGKIQWLDPKKVYDVYVQNPSYFQEVLTGNYSTHILKVNGSQYIQETIAAIYLRGDIKLLRDRLWIVGGVRYERTEDDAAGPLNDPYAYYKKDPDTGKLLRPLQMLDSLSSLTGTNLTVAQNKLRYQERGAKVKRNYDGFYPSLNASYLIMDNLILRASYARTIRRPDYDKIIPGTTVPVPSTDSTTTPTIVVKNTGLKPWQANAFEVSLEYYIQKSSRVGLSLFYKDIKNFFGTLTTPATPDLLELYGLDPSLYGDVDIRTDFNTDKALVRGLEFDYTQQLTFLPQWARGMSVFANGTWLSLSGNRLADFSTFVPRTINWGVSLNRPRYSIMLKWTNQGEQRLTARASTVANRILPDTYEYLGGTTKLDINAEIRITKNVTIYGSARNVTNEKYVLKRYGAGTPEYAKIYNIQEFGVQMVFGVRMNF